MDGLTGLLPARGDLSHAHDYQISNRAPILTEMAVEGATAKGHVRHSGTNEVGANRRFVAMALPDILSADGEPLTLAADIGTGSIVNLQVDGDTLLAI